jgi:two-component system response regulator RegA
MEKTLIIIDDEEMIRKSLTVYFEDLGWQVKSFGSAEEAVACVSLRAPDYAIVDLRLPGMTGLEFIRTCRDLRCGTVFVIYTGSVENGTTRELLNLGLKESQIILKPAASLRILRDALLE